MSEPGLGSDVSAVSTKATKLDDGSHEITGNVEETPGFG